MVAEEIVADVQRSCVRPYPGESCLHGFLRHLTYLSGHGEAALALHLVGFDEQNVAAGGRPSQSDRDTGTLSALRNLCIDADFDSAEEVVDDLRRNEEFFVVPLGDAARLFARDGADEAFKISNSG